MKCFFLLYFLGFSISLNAQDRAFQIFNSRGEKVSYRKMIKALDKSQIILFGEYHNNPISHWLQLELTKSLEETNQLVLGSEVMEADNQEQLNLYLKNELDYKGLDSAARLWPNFKTDYKPLVDFAKDNKLTFVAANIPRRYAKIVFKGGFEALDTLPENEKAWIAPLPIKYDAELPGYKSMLEMMGGHGGENLPKAQAIKDATMAHFILKNYSENKTFIHYNGAYHSNNYEGILWYLKEEKTNIRYATISTVSQAEISKLEEENKGVADFIICVDEDMTTTH